MTYQHLTEPEMIEVAKEFVLSLQGGEVIGLSGDLGAGKTTFVRAMVRAFLGDVRVVSPTFGILQEFRVGEAAIKMIVHVDAYRFKSAQELAALELESYDPASTVICIEWPERVADAIDWTHWIELNHDGEGRSVSIEKL